MLKTLLKSDRNVVKKPTREQGSNLAAAMAGQKDQTFFQSFLDFRCFSLLL